MSTEKKLPPIQLAPFKPFTLRLVDGHFVRIPKVEHIAITDATRPPSALRQETSANGDGAMIPRGLRLVNGHFVNGEEETAPVQVPPVPGSVANRPVPRVELPYNPPSPDSWAYAFRTQLDPSDSAPET